MKFPAIYNFVIFLFEVNMIAFVLIWYYNSINLEMGEGCMSSTIQIRVDDDLKQKSDVLFRELGTDTTSAVRIFLTQAVAHNGFPFEIRKISANPYAAMSEEDILQKLERSRAHASQGMVRDADEVISDMRTKYGL